MFAFPVLDVAIGLSFVYLLLALVASTLNEWVSRICSGRARMLEQGVRRMCGDDDGDSSISEKVLDHPLIQSMAPKGKRPSYIPSDVFARALTDVVNGRRLASQQRDEGGKAASRPAPVPRKLADTFAALGGAPRGQTVPREDVELPNEEVLADWFDAQMERVSGWYKRRTQTVILIIAVVLTVSTNQDSVAVGRRLWVDSALRATAVEAAKARIALGPPLETVEYTEPDSPEPSPPVPQATGCESQSGTEDFRNSLTPDEQAILSGLGGWSGEMDRLHQQGGLRWLLWHVPGWLITAFAVSLGAPFWFDTLKRFVNVRAAGVPPKDSRKDNES